MSELPKPPPSELKPEDEERLSIPLDPETALRGLLGVRADASEGLPDFSEAEVTEHRLVEYLLSPTHPKGREKLKLFEKRFGIGPDDRERCAEVLLEASRQGEVENIRERPDCRVYAISGTMAGLDGLDHAMLICWKVPHDTERPEFVTAYPAPKKRA